jgi:hypothetical protein
MSLWSYAVYDLRITPELFWSISLQAYLALVDRHQVNLEHHELMHAQTTAILANQSRKPKSKPLAPKNFMPHYREPKEKLEPKEQDWNAVALRFKMQAVALASAMGQTVTEIKASPD